MTVTSTSPVIENSVVQLCPFSTGSFTSSTAQFLLTFSEDVAGVAPGDFSPLIESDSLDSGIAVASVQGCGGSGGYQSAYVVTLDNISGAGSIGLQFQDQQAAVTDAGGAPLTGLGACEQLALPGPFHFRPSCVPGPAKAARPSGATPPTG